jgi:segregation and condensation protein A
LRLHDKRGNVGLPLRPDAYCDDNRGMTVLDPFEDPAPDHRPAAESDEAFVLRLESYEGPIDVLLDQARDQKVDLTQISILQLADQFLAFIERARRLRLELAADYLVMAAWLAYLKSRLLLPAKESETEEPTGEEMAAALQFQLRRLEAIRQAGEKLLSLPRLGYDRFARGAPEPKMVVRSTVYQVSLYDLLKAYGDHKRRTSSSGALHIRASRLYTTDQALKRVMAMLGTIPGGWTTLSAFLPERSGDPLVQRSALASTLLASLELAKAGEIDIHQENTYGPIYLRKAEPRRKGGE